MESFFIFCLKGLIIPPCSFIVSFLLSPFSSRFASFDMLFGYKTYLGIVHTRHCPQQLQAVFSSQVTAMQFAAEMDRHHQILRL